MIYHINTVLLNLFDAVKHRQRSIHLSHL